MSTRHIKCPNCEELFRWDYKDPKFKRDRVVDPTLTPRSRRKAYNVIHNKKSKEKKIE